jgi:hypothetical protein
VAAVRQPFLPFLREDFAAGFFFNFARALTEAFAEVFAARLAAAFAAPLPSAFARDNVLAEFLTRGRFISITDMGEAS